MYLMQFKTPYAIPFKYIQVHVDTNITPSQFFRETLLPPQSPPVLPLLPGRYHPGACGRWDRQATRNSCGVSWDFHGIQWGFIKLTAMKFYDFMLVNLEIWVFLNYSAQYARLKTRATDATGSLFDPTQTLHLDPSPHELSCKICSKIGGNKWLEMDKASQLWGRSLL